MLGVQKRLIYIKLMKNFLYDNETRIQAQFEVTIVNIDLFDSSFYKIVVKLNGNICNEIIL